MNDDIKKIIIDLIEDNKENLELKHDNWGDGYASGYNDALVDLLNKFEIKHDYKIIND